MYSALATELFETGARVWKRCVVQLSRCSVVADGEPKRSASLHTWLPISHTALLPELVYYFNNAFGNWTRIDYGSGHELSFVGYLAVLRYTGLLTEQDEEAMVFSLFETYLEVCRKLQMIYRLEPAGSKGVWGLEDHQFLNYLWGSSQLIGRSLRIVCYTHLTSAYCLQDNPISHPVRSWT